MTAKTGDEVVESFAQGSMFSRKAPIFSKWETDEQAIQIKRLEDENYRLRQDGASFVTNATDEEPQKGWNDKGKQQDTQWDSLSCSMCQRIIKNCEAGDEYYVCEKYCKKVFCASCQYKNRVEFTQHP